MAPCGIISGVLALILLTACSRPDLRGGSRSSGAEQVERLRQAFNRGACDSIYDEASTPFRLLQSREDWLVQCHLIRSRLGEWRTVRLSSAVMTSPFDAHVSGTALFARGQGRLEATWTLGDSGLQLLRLQLDSGAWTIVAPSLPSKPLPLVDPPRPPTFPVSPPGASSDTPRTPA